MQYLKEKIRDVEIFDLENSILYNYLKNEETSYDTLYYLRKNNELDMFSICENRELEPEFNSSKDFLTAKIYTVDLLSEFYKTELLYLEVQKNADPQLWKSLSNRGLPWTASKTDLIELIYALHCYGAFDNGNIEIKEITSFIEDIFNIPLGDIYRTYKDIRSRKTNHTKFLDQLKNSLLEHIETSIL